jgi:SanA protein
MKKLIRLFLFIIFIVGVLMVGCWIHIEQAAKSYLYTNIEDVPYHKVGLVLGTAETLSNGHTNPYFTYRIDVATALFEAGKVEALVVSGDNGRKAYNEPLAMELALVARGIPEDRIFADYAGFDTYDSVVRIRDIFGQTSVTIISQDFHAERAIYIAREKGIEAVGFAAKDIEGAGGARVRAREMVARVKAVIDVVLNKDPKFLGEKIDIAHIVD